MGGLACAADAIVGEAPDRGLVQVQRLHRPAGRLEHARASGEDARPCVGLRHKVGGEGQGARQVALGKEVIGFAIGAGGAQGFESPLQARTDPGLAGLYRSPFFAQRRSFFGSAANLHLDASL